MIEDLKTQYLTLHETLIDVDRIPIVMIALLIVMFGGMMRRPLGGNAMPFYWHIVEILFGNLGRKMDKPKRKKGDLIFRGFIFSVFVILFTYFIAKSIALGALIYPHWSAIEIVALCLTMTSGAAMAAQGRLYRALSEKDVSKGAYYMVARSTRTDFSASDDFTITRLGMGLGLKAFDKGVVAPIIWYLLFGLIGAFLYAALAALQWIFGREGYAGGFGQSINALERLMGFIPNIVSGLFIALAGILTPTAGMTRAFLGLMKTKGRASYEEGGLPLTAAAYALNTALGGPTKSLDGYNIPRQWIGPKGATAKLNAKHLHRMVYINFMAHLLFLAALGGMLFYSRYFI